MATVWAGADGGAADLLLGMYYGFMIAAILYNGLLAFSLRSRTCHYSIYIHLFLLLLYLFKNGTAQQFLWSFGDWKQAGPEIMFICLVHAAVLLFVRSLLKELTPRLNRAFGVLIALQPAAMAAAAFHEPLGAVLCVIASVSAHSLMVPACISALRKGQPLAKYFLIGWGVFVLSWAAAEAADAGIVPAVRGTNAFVSQAGSAFLAAVLTWGLTGQIRRMRREMDKTAEKLSESMRLADTDEVTGLYTRRYVSRSFELLTRGRPDREISLLLIDVDHFKQVNDTFGHEAGDTVLQELGKLLRSNMARTDMIGRFGGEEFLVLLPDTALDEARAAAERLVEAVRSREIAIEPGVRVRCTISIGVAQWMGGNETFKQLVRRADNALYKAKRGGRNRAAD